MPAIYVPRQPLSRHVLFTVFFAFLSCLNPDVPSQALSVRHSGPWSPLASPLFRGLWLASLGSNIGTWLQNVAAGWEMTNLTSSPLMVAMVQVAISAPSFFLAIAAGALADIADRRAILIATYVGGAAVAFLLAIVTGLGALNAPTLLLLTFLLGVQWALTLPAWGAMIADIVPRSQLSAAVALGSISFNLSRSIGPALGGLILTVAHPAVTFALNALSFVGVLVVLLRWKRKAPVPRLPPEGFGAAIRGGVRYTLEEPAFRALLLRCALFTLPGAAVFSLLPLVAKGSTLSNAYGYAFLLTAIGLGAVATAPLLPKLRARFTYDRLMAAACVLFAAALAVPAITRRFAWIVLALPLAGAAWITTLSSLQASVQHVAPKWVKARGLAIYFMTLNGAVAAGGLLWGGIASNHSVQMALAVASAALLVAALWFARGKLGKAEIGENVETGEAPAPHFVDDIPNDAGPVQVSIEYNVRPDAIDRFIVQMQELGRLRRRDGVFAWECSFDIHNRTHAIETFQVESWLEHLRQHDRQGPQFFRVLEDVRAICVGTPLVRHFVSINAGALDLKPHPDVADE
jgi:MFS family permease